MTTEVYEVEMKFPLPQPERVWSRLNELNAHWHGVVVQVDEYWAHPTRDFARTDEAFRIRSVGVANCLTYKGPKLDARTKTRQEIEVAFAEGEVARGQMRSMLVALEFTSVAAVRKSRQEGSIFWLDREIVLAFDQVEGAGKFLELEICTTAEDMPAAKEAILGLAEKLDLGECERRSYLEICLASRNY